MSILRFIDIQNYVAQGTPLDIDIAANLTKIKAAINTAYGKLAIKFPSPSRQRILTLQTVATITDGTASVTEGSRTITIAGATPAAAHKGRFFSLNNPDTAGEQYEIVAVSGQTYTIRDPYRGATTTGANYRVFVRYYDLPSAVADVSLVRSPGGIWVKPLSFSEFQQRTFEGLLIPNQPSAFALFSNPATISTYTVAAVVSTVNTFDWTATSGLLGVVDPGDRILNWDSANSYQVNSVDSDTAFTTYQRAVASVPAATATFERRQAMRLWVNPPADKIYHIEYSALLKIPDMVHDNDEPFMLPEDTQKHTITGGLFELGRYVQSTRRAEFAAEQQAGVDEIRDAVKSPVGAWLEG